MYAKLARYSAAAGLVLGVATVAAGQEPVRLPGVVVRAPIEKPGPRALAGVVRDTFALPIDSVEVSIPDLKRRAATDGDGKFRFDDIGPGKYDVRARKIGYAPQVRTVTVDRNGGVGTFELLQFQRALPPVVVNAARGGIGGVVGDTSYHAIRGATVRLAGEGQTVETDSSGYFHFEVAAGEYYLTVNQTGFASKVVSVRVPADSGRRVSIFLEPRAESPREHWNIDDMNERLVMRTATNSTLYSREDLIDMHVQWISEAVQGGYTRAAVGRISILDDDCAAIVDGGPRTTLIKDLTIDDVATIEIYPPGVTTAQRSLMMDRPPSRLVGKKSVADSRAVMPFQNAERAAIQNGARNCAVVYVWTR
jgi:hypothetical protein